jgi:hypothetical protein
LLARSPLSFWSLGAGRIFPATAVLGISLLMLGCHTGPSFEEYRALVTASAGAGASDCGFVKLRTSKTEAISCVESALRGGRPVFVIFQIQGIDSQIFMGLAVDQTGKAVRIMWDSDASGGGSRYMSKARIEKTPCDQPALKNDNETVHCAPTVSSRGDS